MTGGVLIDANLLCLLVVGRVDRRAIPIHPRLHAFDADDFVVLTTVSDRLGDPIFCPQVLAETSNLLGYRQSSAQQARWRTSLADLVAFCLERTEHAVVAVKDAAYARLGFTDAVLMTLASDRSLALLSDDLHLCIEAERRGVRTINYNHLRDGSVRPEQF